MVGIPSPVLERKDLWKILHFNGKYFIAIFSIPSLSIPWSLTMLL